MEEFRALESNQSGWVKKGLWKEVYERKQRDVPDVWTHYEEVFMSVGDCRVRYAPITKKQGAIIIINCV